MLRIPNTANVIEHLGPSRKGIEPHRYLLGHESTFTEGDPGRYTGGETGKASLLPQAKTQLLKALHLDPGNSLLRFNLATVMQANPYCRFPQNIPP